MSEEEETTPPPPDYSAEIVSVAQTVSQLGDMSTQNSQLISSQIKNVAFRLEQLNRWDEVKKLTDEVKISNKWAEEIYKVFTDPDKGLLFSPNLKPDGLDHIPYGRYDGNTVITNAITKMSMTGDDRKLDIIDNPPEKTIDEYIENHAYVGEKMMVESVEGACIVRSFRSEKLGSIKVSLKNPGERDPITRTIRCSCVMLNYSEEREVTITPEGSTIETFDIPVKSSKNTKSPYYIKPGEYTVTVNTEDDNGEATLNVVLFSRDCGSSQPAESFYELDEPLEEDGSEDSIEDLDNPSPRKEEHIAEPDGKIKLDLPPNPEAPTSATIDDFPIDIEDIGPNDPSTGPGTSSTGPDAIGPNEVKISDLYGGENVVIDYTPAPIKDIVDESHLLTKECIKLLDVPEIVSVSIKKDDEDDRIRSKGEVLEGPSISLLGHNVESIHSIVLNNETDITAQDVWEFDGTDVEFSKRLRGSYITVYYLVPEIEDSELVYEINRNDPRIVCLPVEYLENKVLVSYRIADMNVEDDVLICNNNFQLRHFPVAESIIVKKSGTDEVIKSRYYMLDDELSTIEFSEDYNKHNVDIYYNISSIREEDGLFEILEVRNNFVKLSFEPKYETIRVVNKETNEKIPETEYFLKDFTLILNKKHNRKTIVVYYYPEMKEGLDECFNQLTGLESTKRKVCKVIPNYGGK